jgi:hypothetical protein
MIEKLDFNPSSPSWLWLFPLTYIIHIFEEYRGGIVLSSSLSEMHGFNLTPTEFLRLTIVGLMLIVIGIIIARKFRFPQLLSVILATVISLNGLSHTISSCLSGAYNPGLISGLLIWLPLGAITLLYLRRSMRHGRYWMGVIIGLAISGVVSWLALGGGKTLN